MMERKCEGKYRDEHSLGLHQLHLRHRGEAYPLILASHPPELVVGVQACWLLKLKEKAIEWPELELRYLSHRTSHWLDHCLTWSFIYSRRFGCLRIS